MKLYRKFLDDEGVYVAADGSRWMLQVVRWSNHPELFTPFASVDACLEEWGLTYDPLSGPTAE